MPDINTVANLPKVSVIIPTYNRKELLSETLESVLAQDYPNLEIIITDNASTDGTVKLMEDHSRDERVKYIRHKQNTGFVYNFKNAFLTVATGKYAMVLCDDDCLLDSKYISHAIAMFLANPNVVLVHANCKLVNTVTNEFQITAHKAQRITKGIEYFLNYEQPGYEHIVGFVTAIFNSRKALEIGAFDIEDCYGCDLIIYLRLMLAGDVGVIDDCAGLYKFHDRNISNSLDALVCDETIHELEKTKDLAILLGIDAAFMEQWLYFRVWRYVRWKITAYCSSGNHEAIKDLLEDIALTYPKVYQTIRPALNI